MQTALSRGWTQITDFFPYLNNYYAKHNLKSVE